MPVGVPSLSLDKDSRLVSAYVISSLDYCNSVLTGMTKSTTTQLQRMQNRSKATRTTGSHHILTALHDLHWLLVKFRITYKWCLMLYSTTNQRCPDYTARLLSATARHQVQGYVQPSAIVMKCQRFALNSGREPSCFNEPTAWNNLPTELTNI